MNSININHNVNVVNMVRKNRRGAARQLPPRRPETRADQRRAIAGGREGTEGLHPDGRRRGAPASAPRRRTGTSPTRPSYWPASPSRGFLDLHAALTAVDAADPKRRVIELGNAYVRWAVAHPDHYRVMFGAEINVADHPTLAVAAEQAFGDLLDAITGIIKDQDPLEIAGPLWSLVHGVASLAIGGELRRGRHSPRPGDDARRHGGPIAGRSLNHSPYGAGLHAAPAARTAED